LRIYRIILASIFGVLSLSQYAVAANLKVQLRDNRSGRPLGGKKACVLFSQDPATNNHGQRDALEYCHRTDVNGDVIVALSDDPSLQWTYISVLTNDFVPCFAIPHAFSTSDLMKVGAIAANTCGPANGSLTAQPGTIIIYGHQMNFWEVPKSIRGELPL
jgi:hypothetical protein